MTKQQTTWFLARLLTAWAFALVAGILVVTLVPLAQRPEWLVAAVGLSVVVTFVLQLGTSRREGFITRLSFSIAGSTVIILLADVFAVLLR